MDGKKRREKIMEILRDSEDAISGSELSKKLNVSRQVIVQDIALLRAVEKDILSTTRGYILNQQEKQKVTRSFAVSHTTEEMEDELFSIVDNGGKVLNVMVSHDLYGEITTDLVLSNRQDVKDFIHQVNIKKIVPLKELTGGIHSHTIEADNEAILDNIEKELIRKKYLRLP